MERKNGEKLRRIINDMRPRNYHRLSFVRTPSRLVERMSTLTQSSSFFHAFLLHLDTQLVFIIYFLFSMSRKYVGEYGREID